MTAKLSPALFFGILSLSGTFAAEPAPAIAVVDMTQVFAEHPSTAAATAELTKAREASRASFKEKSNVLKEVLQQHQELIRAQKRDEAAEALKAANEAERAIATLRTTELRDLEEEFRKAKTRILSEIQSAIAVFNKEGRYAMIFDSSSTSSNGLPQVLHAPGAVDITAEVIAFVKERAKAGQNEAPPKP